MEQRAESVGENVATAPVAASSDLRLVRRCASCRTLIISVPMLHCSGCGQEHPLRCFTYQRGPLHIAECLDLDLLAQGSTEEEAIGKLQEAVHGYLAVVFEGAPCPELVPRRAPLTHWLRYYLRRLKTVPKRLRLGRHLLSPTTNRETQRLSHCS